MKSKIIFWSALVISLGLAVAAGYVFCTRPAIEGAALSTLIPAYILLAFLSIIFGDLVHEGAHLIVGLCCRMGIRPDKYRIFRTSSVNVYPFGARAMRGRMIATSVAGIVINFACFALGLMAVCIPQMPALFGVLLPYSAYLLILNAIPDYRNGAENDGMMVWELIKKSDSALVMLQILRIQGLVRAGTPMKEVPEEMFFSVPQLPEDDINFIILTQLRYEYYLECGNDSEAYKFFLRYKDLIQYLPSEYVEEPIRKHNKAKDE